MQWLDAIFPEFDLLNSDDPIGGFGEFQTLHQLQPDSLEYRALLASPL